MQRRPLPRQLSIWGSLLILAACASGPKLTIYTSDPDRFGMQFYNQRNGQKGFVKYEVTQDFTCLEPPDLNLFLNYCRQQKEIGIQATGPAVTIYISDPTQGGMEFYNARTDESGFVEYNQTDKFTCLDPPDTQTLLDYCGVKDDPKELLTDL